MSRRCTTVKRCYGNVQQRQTLLKPSRHAALLSLHWGAQLSRRNTPTSHRHGLYDVTEFVRLDDVVRAVRSAAVGDVSLDLLSGLPADQEAGQHPGGVLRALHVPQSQHHQTLLGRREGDGVAGGVVGGVEADSGEELRVEEGGACGEQPGQLSGHQRVLTVSTQRGGMGVGGAVGDGRHTELLHQLQRHLQVGGSEGAGPAGIKQVAHFSWRRKHVQLKQELACGLGLVLQCVHGAGQHVDLGQQLHMLLYLLL